MIAVFVLYVVLLTGVFTQFLRAVDHATTWWQAAEAVILLICEFSAVTLLASWWRDKQRSRG